MSAEALDLLRSIDASLKRLVACFEKTQPKAIASDRDLDGQYGDPVVRFMPRDWTGPSMKGRRFSQCEPDFLEMLAETLDYFGQQSDANGEKTNGGKPLGDYKRQDAARARGWAKRQRDGSMPVAAGLGDRMTSEWDGDPGF